MTEKDEVHSFGEREGHVFIGPYAGYSFIGDHNERIRTHVDIHGNVLRITLWRGRTGRKLFGKIILPLKYDDMTTVSDDIRAVEKDMTEALNLKTKEEYHDVTNIMRGFGPGEGLIFIQSDENTHDIEWGKERQEPVQQEGEQSQVENKIHI